MSKYKRGLYVQAKEQKLLKEKYGCDDLDESIKAPNPLCNAFFRLLCAAVIFLFAFLAVTGLAALIIPACRQALFTALQSFLSIIQ